MDAVRAHFRPEFLNRIDEVILFHPLSRTHLASIIDIQARHLLKRLEDRKIHVELSDRAASCWSRRLRPGVRGAAAEAALQKLVLDPLAVACSKASSAKATP